MSGRMMTMLGVGVLLLALMWWKSYDVETKRNEALRKNNPPADAGPR